MIKLSKPVTSSIPFINILSFSSQRSNESLLVRCSPIPKPKHLSSSSPECPIRANVIAHIIMGGGGGARFHSCVYLVCSMMEQTGMIQLHQSDWIMISMWVASASSFLSLPDIVFTPSLSSSPFLLPCLSTFSTPHLSTHTQPYFLRAVFHVL